MQKNARDRIRVSSVIFLHFPVNGIPWPCCISAEILCRCNRGDADSTGAHVADPEHCRPYKDISGYVCFLHLKTLTDFLNLRGINNTPLHCFQMDGTLNQYCTVIIRQLAMLMRAKKTYTIPLSSELQQTIGAFRDALPWLHHRFGKNACLGWHKVGSQNG